MPAQRLTDRMIVTMDLTLAVTVVSFLSAGAGAYLGSYLKKKGENLATHEDIDKLVDQVSAVTRATTQIETKISSDLWDRQKQWELKREILFDAAKKLSEIDNKLSSLQTFWEHLSQGKIEGEESRIRLENKYVTEWTDCMRSFEETESLILVTCSRETMQVFAELSDLLRYTSSRIVSGDLETYAKTKAERLKKLVLVRVGIRKELGINFDLTPQSNTFLANPNPVH
jgi:hypothetical protein